MCATSALVLGNFTKGLEKPAKLSADFIIIFSLLIPHMAVVISLEFTVIFAVNGGGLWEIVCCGFIVTILNFVNIPAHAHKLMVRPQTPLIFLSKGLQYASCSC